jgi:DNA-binding transcriptional LysR family regulator
MELKWVEDYLALVDTGNFTTAATLRHLSQPAFSRRIQSLEAWLGVELVDRSKKPLRFTAAAIEHETALRNLVNVIYRARNQIKFSVHDQLGLSVAAQHSLLVTSFLPKFLEKLSASLNNLNYSVISENMDTCVAMFLKGDVDMLIIYETEGDRNVIMPHLSVRKPLGTDEMILVVTPKVHQGIQKSKGTKTLPLLTYPISSYFGRVIWADVLPKVLRHENTSIACESTFAVGLREMALASTGAAWVPRSIVLKEIERGALIILDNISPPIPMQVVAHLSRVSDGPAIAKLRDIL